MVMMSTDLADRGRSEGQRPLWYAPHPRIRSRAAAVQANVLATGLQRGGSEQAGMDESSLFVAMHTCAYRANPRRPRSRPASRAAWIQRWKAIREHMVERNLGLVYSMMARFRAPGVDRDELLSEALTALSHAVERFNPWKGFRFSTYACNVILRALVRRSRRENQYRQRFPVQYESSMELPGRTDDATGLFLERLRRIMTENRGGLSALESRVLAQRFPANGRTRLTFQQLGDAIGLSKERVRQIQNAALDKLRRKLDEDDVLR